ncbi:MAG: PspC domain-containing protein [Methanosarcina sp.]
MRREGFEEKISSYLHTQGFAINSVIPGVTYKLYISNLLCGLLSHFSIRSGEMNKLYRSKKNKIIAGVCGGISEYFKIDPTLVRLLWLLVSVMSVGAGLVAYIIAWIIIPEEP